MQSAIHCTTCTIGIRCHVSANGSVVPSMVLRYCHDLRVGKGTNQHGNRFALSTYVLLLLLRFTTYSHPTFGLATVHPHSTSSDASAGTVVHIGIGDFAASSGTPISCQFVSITIRYRFRYRQARSPWSDAGRIPATSNGSTILSFPLLSVGVQ